MVLWGSRRRGTPRPPRRARVPRRGGGSRRNARGRSRRKVSVGRRDSRRVWTRRRGVDAPRPRDAQPRAPPPAPRAPPPRARRRGVPSPRRGSLRVRRGGLLADPARHLEREVGVLLAHRANVHREGLHLLRQRYGRRALVRVRGVAQAPPARTNGQRGEGAEAMRTWSRLGSGCRRGRVGRTTERTKADVVIPSRGTHAFWWYRNCRQSSSNSSHSACMRSWSSSSDAILAAPSSQATPAAPREGILAAPPTASDNTRKFARRDSPAVSENVSFSISL